MKRAYKVKRGIQRMMIWAIVLCVLILILPMTLAFLAGDLSNLVLQKLGTVATIFSVAISVLTACLSMSLALDEQDRRS